MAGYGAARRFSKKIYLRNRTLPPVTVLVIGMARRKFVAVLRFERLGQLEEHHYKSEFIDLKWMTIRRLKMLEL